MGPRPYFLHEGFCAKYLCALQKLQHVPYKTIPQLMAFLLVKTFFKTIDLTKKYGTLKIQKKIFFQLFQFLRQNFTAVTGCSFIKKLELEICYQMKKKLSKKPPPIEKFLRSKVTVPVVVGPDHIFCTKVFVCDTCVFKIF